MPPANPTAPHMYEDEPSIRFHQREWSVRRIAYAVFVLVLAGALLGVFGDGPLATTSATRDGTTLRYDRFVRGEGDFSIRVRSTGKVTIAIRGICGPGEEVRCVPPAASDSPRDSESLLVFGPDPGRSTIELCWKPRYAGLRRGSVTIDGARFDAWVLVYP